jgi:chromosome segregation protein
MYLKSLEVVGFKSFADPTKIEFHRGVTCVVGPNGCGKSNVLDAIRWVLGEQSAKALRGGSMQDVIFSGTDSRKPFGMAEVAMTFAECEDALGTDYHEVRIARRVFRDGHGEYEINKAPCRLRDIHRLFMDTGIGRSAYSIMEQGKIDMILSSKPEERRAVFEEAAGITRFKAQKKEALRKLDATESNLIRVSDIIKEVNRQIGSLQRQANKARRYQELFDRLKLLDTHLAARRYAELQEQMQSSQSRHQSLQMEFDQLQSEMEGHEQALEEKRRRLEQSRQRHRAAEQEQTTARAEIEKAEQSVEFNRRRITELEEMSEDARKDVVAAEEKITVQVEQESGSLNELKTVQAEFDQVHGELEGKKTRLEEARQHVEKFRQERNRLDQELGQTEELLLQARNRLAGFEARRTSFQTQLDRWAAGDRECEDRIQAATTAEKDARAAFERSQTEVEGAKSTLQAVDRELAAAENEKSQAAVAWAEAQSAYHHVEVRVDALKQLLSGNEDQEGSAKLSSALSGRGFRGAMIEFIEIDSGYETAIEACLGKANEALIFETDEKIEEAAGLLNEEEGAVLARDIPESGLRRFFERIPAESALNRVALKEGGSHVLRKILKQYLVAEHRDEALHLRQQYPHHHIVGKDGQIWFREGWEIRGKVTRSGRSLVQHRHEYNHLNAKLAELKGKVEATRQNAESATARFEELSRKKEAAQKTFEKKREDAAHTDIELKSAERDLKDARQRLEQRGQDKSELHSGLEEGDQSITSARGEIESLEESRRDLQKRIESHIRELQGREEVMESRRQEVSDARVIEAGVQQRLKSIREQEESVRTRLEELRQVSQQRQKDIESYRQKMDTCRQAITEAENKIRSSRESVQQLEAEFRRLSMECQELEARVSDFEAKVKASRTKASEVQSQFGKEEVAVAQHRMKAEALEDRIHRAYQIHLSQWTPGEPLPRTQEDLQLVELEPSEGVLEQDTGSLENWILSDRPHRRPQDEELLQGQETNWNQIEEEIEALRERIDRMGPVNVEAITEYAELEERQRFLQHQEEDLTSARDRLHEAIRRINVTTRELFSDTFSQIQKNFTEMFQELFGGGKASLSLDDDSDPLESGIEIVAKPPGKQLQSISLLSGGERTMTAVALLFSIYMVKPSPFCFLDEMDAPLDESNINRFIRILQRFVQQSQFCVITHNKRTISAADVIYGVTMQEQGVSRVVSVKLNRKEEDPLFENDDDDVTIADSVRSGKVMPS